MGKPIAKQIILTRHGEKPTKTEVGIDYNGKEDINSLIVRGWQRAGAFVQIFKDVKSSLSIPNHLFACYKTEHAQRSLDLITPLADYLKLKVDTSIARDKEKKMAKVAMKCEGTVLIAWEHQCLHFIANKIMGNETTVPQFWPEDRFDIFYVFDLQDDGTYKFSQVPQMALVGDSTKLLSLKTPKKSNG